ncbi:MAG: membrane protein insertion efficiency factor YidD [Promicromonosporaceae bacterium]|nr:membrane protein insertion efficiency factor YidD [Promicromonosporaceae bacterium]
MPRLVLTKPIGWYQRYVSVLSPPRCKYYPSCSRYAMEAIEAHGALRGARLAAWRLLRCNPWSLGGVDDVPPSRDGQKAVTTLD